MKNKRMRVALIYFLFIVLPAGCSPSKRLSPSTEIVWFEAQRLTWDDFVLRAGAPGLFKAYTTAGMRYAIDAPNDRIRIVTEAYFVKPESWVHIDHRNPLLLRHEQGHFDLAAVFSKRLALALAPLEVDAALFMEQRLQEEANAIFNVLYNELNEHQMRYDTETVHGTNREKQQEWELWISTELNH
jgi:hypothetical protein